MNTINVELDHVLATWIVYRLAILVLGVDYTV